MHSCASYETATNKKDEKKYFSSIGFSLIYEDEYYSNKLVNKKIDNNKIRVLHNTLRSSTPIRIINPDNLKFIDTKITRTANYPKIFNSVISKEISRILDLDIENPYVEIIEIKKNKTFIARKANTFEEEKNFERRRAKLQAHRREKLGNIPRIGGGTSFNVQFANKNEAHNTLQKLNKKLIAAGKDEDKKKRF